HVSIRQLQRGERAGYYDLHSEQRLRWGRRNCAPRFWSECWADHSRLVLGRLHLSAVIGNVHYFTVDNRRLRLSQSYLDDDADRRDRRTDVAWRSSHQHGK